MAHRGMKFGIFLAPFHRVGENPTLAINRDVELLEWLDWLGYDEAWIGEHHSAGWELIALPELVIAAAAERTKHIRLGTGVTSLPYHHPFMVAQRFVQLDHMTRGRAMMGCGPGALTSDAYMLGIEPSTQRPRMLEAMDAIMRLLKCEEPVTMKTDWFEMRDARLHLAPYTDPHFEIAVASTITPFGMIAAGNARRGRAVDRRRSAWRAGSARPASGRSPKRRRRRTARRWTARTGASWSTRTSPRTTSRRWREVKKGERVETMTYFEDTLGRPPGRADDPLREGVKMGTTLVGSPETVCKGIRRLLEYSQGGFGGILFRAHEWANREQTLRSYELFARYVMPQFQGSLGQSSAPIPGRARTVSRCSAQRWNAVRRAFTDFGHDGARGGGPCAQPRCTRPRPAAVDLSVTPAKAGASSGSPLSRG